MFTNLFLGFVIPWTMGSYLFFRARKLLLIIAPFASTMAFLINNWGFHNRYWSMKPYEFSSYSSIPYNIGIYPVNASFLIYFIHMKSFNPARSVVIVSLFTLVEELCGVYIGHIVYHNGWNAFFTFISYLIAYSLCYCYYLLLRKAKVFT